MYLQLCGHERWELRKGVLMDMITKIVIEAIVYSLIYAAFMMVIFKAEGVRKQLYNYPPAIQARAIERGITTQEEMDATAKKNKII